MGDFHFTLKCEKVDFLDGDQVVGTLEVHQAVYSDDVRLAEMTLSAIESGQKELMEAAQGGKVSSEDFKRQYFKTTIYPKMAACSTGDVPTVEQAMAMPSSEINKWYRAAERVNPEWFAAFKEITERKVADLEKTPEGKEQVKKKERRRRRS